jgi:hypothetical protein
VRAGVEDGSPGAPAEIVSLNGPPGVNLQNGRAAPEDRKLKREIGALRAACVALTAITLFRLLLRTHRKNSRLEFIDGLYFLRVGRDF